MILEKRVGVPYAYYAILFSVQLPIGSVPTCDPVYSWEHFG